MKKFLLINLILAAGFLQAQENIQTTSSFSIDGKIKSPYVFSFAKAGDFKSISIDSVVIYNHLRQRKNAVKNLKGILLKDILSKVEFDSPNPKLLNEFYITCIASDGFKAVFSWNEIFNTDTGKAAIILTEKNGKKGAEMDDCIALLCAADHATGRRFVKGLKKIIVARVK